MRSIVLLAVVISVALGMKVASTGAPFTLPVDIVKPTAFTLLKVSNASTLHRVVVPNASNPYTHAPYVLNLRGSRFQVGYDYAALLANETSYTLTTFLNSVTPSVEKQQAFLNFSDFLWNTFYIHHTPQEYLDELTGMEAWWGENSHVGIDIAPHFVARHFYTLANMPADAPNIISGLEQEFERGWPQWLKDLVNGIIDVIEHLSHKCDAYGVWGSRTASGRLYTSRNLDYQSNTGINRFKLIQVFQITDKSGRKLTPYATMGFSFGPGALAGQSLAGITTSEMNLDNSNVTFSGLPFPLRLRHILEHATNLETAMTLWNTTNNTNSFNFLIGSAEDKAAFALETMRGFTGVFPADSPIERNATYDCGEAPHVDPTCAEWTDKTGLVRIGFPAKEAVWRTNHGMNPRIMATQEPLFNGTVFRYNLMRDLFAGFQAANVKIGDAEAVGIVASLGTKGNNFLTCDQVLNGDNVLSVAYVPGEARFFVAWEDGSGSAWRPAACAPYLAFNITQLMQL